MNQGFVFSDHVDISFPEKFYKPVYGNYGITFAIPVVKAISFFQRNPS